MTISAGRIDLALRGPESDAKPLSPAREKIYQGTQEKPSAAISAPSRPGYRGMVRVHESDMGPFQHGGNIWSMALIKTLDTGFVDDEGKYRTVEDVLPEVMDKVSKFREYEYLLKSFQVYGQQVPVRVMVPIPQIPNRLRDGVNRIAIAEYLGWETMLVTWGIMEKSMWEDWDKSDQGQQFHAAKARRLGLS